ncbi:GH10279 [Drosophila grimshawi]|uniref:GH10279 n=1 Tax=Drosophila grimshawi TaxID=7222 RepID=B4JAQ5_DROGR|nr:GH10279 [Drosophila grimshawi]
MISGLRTVSDEAAVVLAGMLPLDIPASEMKLMRARRNSQEGKVSIAEIRRSAGERWIAACHGGVPDLTIAEALSGTRDVPLREVQGHYSVRVLGMVRYMTESPSHGKDVRQLIAGTPCIPGNAGMQEDSMANPMEISTFNGSIPNNPIKTDEQPNDVNIDVSDVKQFSGSG